MVLPAATGAYLLLKVDARRRSCRWSNRARQKIKPASSAPGVTFIAVDTVGAGEGGVLIARVGVPFTPDKPLPVEAIIGISRHGASAE
jgi:hypothetical protein